MFFPIASPVLATDIIYGKRLQVKRDAAWSPSKRYKVETIPYMQRMQDNQRSHLFLIQQGQRKRLPVKLKETNGYDHFVEILWAPNSKSFAVNQWEPGLTARAYVYDINDLGHRIDIEERLKQLINDKKQARVFEGITIQGTKVLATRWINSKLLEVKIQDDKADAVGNYSESFSLSYRWNLKDSLIAEPH